MNRKERHWSGESQSKLESLWILAAAGDETALSWSPQDLTDILDHFLSAPVFPELGAAGIGTDLSRKMVSGSSGPDGRQTFGDLLLSSHPDEDVLRMVKRYAKKALQSANELLPPEVAKVIYTASLACARAAGFRRFSRLARTDYERSVRWCLAQGWVTQPMRRVLRRGIADLDARTGRPEEKA